MKNSDIQIIKVKNIADLYNIDLSKLIRDKTPKLEAVIDNFISALCYKSDIEEKNIFLSLYETANLIKHLKATLDHKEKIYISTIYKNIKTNCELSTFENITNLYEFECELLYKNQCLLSNKLLKISDDVMIEIKENPLFNSLEELTHRLDDIIQILKYNIDSFHLFEKKSLIIKIGKIRKIFRSFSVFDKSYKVISTKEACFLYDTLMYLEVIPENNTMNEQEKFQFIKRYIK